MANVKKTVVKTPPKGSTETLYGMEKRKIGTIADAATKRVVKNVNDIATRKKQYGRATEHR